PGDPEQRDQRDEQQDAAKGWPTRLTAFFFAAALVAAADDGWEFRIGNWELGIECTSRMRELTL
ncbi:MAG: hypothetical protein F6K31_29650, partial [Symploca sp. SIO2G7]|nr:hypothetical protein [Symploca sp. SIO2G7]